MSNKLRSSRDQMLMVHAQGAFLVFEGDQIEPASTTFAEWLSVEHDRKGGQLGVIIYSNGKVCVISIQVRHVW
jgi:hypothetical protein